MQWATKQYLFEAIRFLLGPYGKPTSSVFIYVFVKRLTNPLLYWISDCILWIIFVCQSIGIELVSAIFHLKSIGIASIAKSGIGTSLAWANIAYIPNTFYLGRISNSKMVKLVSSFLFNHPFLELWHCIPWLMQRLSKVEQRCQYVNLWNLNKTNLVISALCHEKYRP